MYFNFFLSDVYLFYFFSNLIIIRLARISTMLHRSDRSRHPYFVPNLRASALSLSPSNIMLAIGLFFLFFYCWQSLFWWEYFLLCLVYCEVLLFFSFTKSVLTIIWLFQCFRSVKMNILLFIFSLFNVIGLYWLIFVC